MKKNISESGCLYNNIKKQNQIVRTNKALKKSNNSQIVFKNTQNIPIASRKYQFSPTSQNSNKKMVLGAFSALFLGCSSALILIETKSYPVSETQIELDLRE